MNAIVSRKLLVNLLSVFIVIIPIIVIHSCTGRSNSESVQISPENVKEQPRDTLVVKIYTVTTKGIQKKISANGVIRSKREIEITSETYGKINFIDVVNGKYVKKGEKLASFDGQEIFNRLTRLRLHLYNSEQEYKSQLLAYADLLKDKSGREAEEIQKKLQISTGYSLYKQDVFEAEQARDKLTLTAPFSGVVTRVNIHEGQFINQGTHLYTIYDNNNMYLEAKILESNVSQVSVGLPAEIYSISSPSTKISASIVEIDPMVDALGFVPVKLKISNEVLKRVIKNSNLIIFPGMNCYSNLLVPIKEALTVPKEAIVHKGDKAIVFTSKGGIAIWNEVTLGYDNGDDVEILSGIKDGDKVIIENNIYMSNGTSIIERNR